MTKLTYQQLLGLDEARTQGEWSVNDQTASGWMNNSLYVTSNANNFLRVYKHEQEIATAQFIAAAPQAIAMLKRYREGLQQIIAEAIEHWPDAENWPVIQDMQALLDDKEG